MRNKRKIRVNISVEKELLEKARKKLGLFGGKLSTLFNLYLQEFVESIDEKVGSKREEMYEKIKELEHRIKKLEGK